MILIVHMLFGAALGSIVKNPALAVFLAFLGHYFLDIFPHIEYLKSTEGSIKKIKSGKWQEYLPDILKVFLDFCLGILIIFIFSKNQPIIYVCAAIAIVPDGLTVIHNLFPNTILKKHHQIHGGKIHFLKHKKTRALNELSARPSTKNIIFSALVSIPFRITTQVLVALVSIILLKL